MNWCSPGCREALAIGKLKQIRENQVKQQERAKSREQKDNRKAVKKLLANDRRRQFNLTKEAAQRLANRLDQDLPCISCSKPRGRVQFCGGHYKTAGAHPERALMISNIHGQCNRECNMAKSGNLSGDKNSHGFIAGLTVRYGEDFLAYLNDHNDIAAPTIPELVLMRKVFNAEIRSLEKGNPPSKDWRETPREYSL